MRTSLLALLASFVALATTASAVAATAGPSALTAKLTATTHAPTVGAPWKWTVSVADAGKPVAAKARIQIVAFGVVVGCLKSGRMQPCTGAAPGDVLSFVGRKAGTIRWTPESRAVSLTFQVVVTAGGKTTRLRYPLKVR